jgi:uncharacterized protein (TIGR02996 family)
MDILDVIHAHPADDLAWLALADSLEEQGEVKRAELTRLSAWLRHRRGADAPAWEDRQRRLLASGVLPCVPELVNGIGMWLALVPAGRFLMGSPTAEAGRFVDEGPQHEVEITRPFYLGVYPVTQVEYQRVMGTNPSSFSSTGRGKEEVAGLDTSRFPVESVSWDDAVEFCRRLTELDTKKPSGHVYRLPREAEWEYACRGGAASSQPFHVGATISSHQANFDGNNTYEGGDKGLYLSRTCIVGSYPPNAFGLYDMHGNVWEWCGDWYDEIYYATSPKQDPICLLEVHGRVVRGGSWLSGGRNCRSAYRSGIDPVNRFDFLGFRVVLSPV